MRCITRVNFLHDPFAFPAGSKMFRVRGAGRVDLQRLPVLEGDCYGDWLFGRLMCRDMERIKVWKRVAGSMEKLVQAQGQQLIDNGQRKWWNVCILLNLRVNVQLYDFEGASTFSVEEVCQCKDRRDRLSDICKVLSLLLRISSC